MTPAARLSAAITVLDDILSGSPTEGALTAWGRASRFAGSGDRHAVRDLVFTALRCKRSFAALGGSLTGRGLILGGARAAGLDVDTLFSGQGHAPAEVSEFEAPRIGTDLEMLDCPDWLAPQLRSALGDDFAPIMTALQHRAPVFLRVNTAQCAVPKAQLIFADAGVDTILTPLAKNALQVTDGERKIQNTNAYKNGMIELQDAASQAVIEALEIAPNARVLDMCAGGGGKTLALAAAGANPLFAWDAAPRRMADLPERAARAGAQVTVLETPASAAPYDLIVIDAPCSGSGSWRRDPHGKWALTPDRLAEVTAIQAQILEQAAGLLAPNGTIAYITCSMLPCENQDQIAAFTTQNRQFSAQVQRNFSPISGGDGFFLAILTQKAEKF